MQFKPEQVYTFVAFVSAVLGMWSILSAKMTKQENRNTVLEKDIESVRTLFIKDGLHPNAEGNKRMYPIILDKLRSLIEYN